MSVFRPQRSRSVQFNCFSPPIMLATFVIEITLAIYTIVRYKLDTLGKLVVVSLVSLAVFQLCEYHVCGGWGIRATEWARAGFVSISLLPPLGLHILHVLADKPRRRLVLSTYATTLAFAAYFLLRPAAFSGYACTGNYVIFQIGTRPALLYGLYYYGWLLTAIGLGVAWAQRFKWAGADRRKHMLGIQALILGYLVFLVPTALANSVDPSTRRGIPSIMCGFAVLFAFILTLYIMPRFATKRIHAPR